MTPDPGPCIYNTYLSEEYKIDLLTEVERKIAVNEAWYPVEKAKGSAKKYSALDCEWRFRNLGFRLLIV